jgi:hypothetical protein
VQGNALLLALTEKNGLDIIETSERQKSKLATKHVRQTSQEKWVEHMINGPTTLTQWAQEPTSLARAKCCVIVATAQGKGEALQSILAGERGCTPTTVSREQFRGSNALVLALSSPQERKSFSELSAAHSSSTGMSRVDGSSPMFYCGMPPHLPSSCAILSETLASTRSAASESSISRRPERCVDGEPFVGKCNLAQDALSSGYSHEADSAGQIGRAKAASLVAAALLRASGGAGDRRRFPCLPAGVSDGIAMALAAPEERARLVASRNLAS